MWAKGMTIKQCDKGEEEIGEMFSRCSSPDPTGFGGHHRHRAIPSSSQNAMPIRVFATSCCCGCRPKWCRNFRVKKESAEEEEEKEMEDEPADLGGMREVEIGM
jgi:hypothetical protein